MSTSPDSMTVDIGSPSLALGGVKLNDPKQGEVVDDGHGGLIDSTGEVYGKVCYQTGTLIFELREQRPFIAVFCNSFAPGETAA